MGLGTNYHSFSRPDLSCWVRSECRQCWDTWRGPKRNFTRRAAPSNLSFREKSKARCRTAEMTMGLPAKRAIARTVYEEADSTCGKCTHSTQLTPL